jgi:hypothetical protein
MTVFRAFDERARRRTKYCRSKNYVVIRPVQDQAETHLMIHNTSDIYTYRLGRADVSDCQWPTRALIDPVLGMIATISPPKRVRRESRCFSVGDRPTRELVRSAR